MLSRDQRQLKAMLSQIESFRAGKDDLNGLVSSLELLYQALAGVSKEWLEAFWNQWGQLEEIYSLSVVREKPLSDSDWSIVNQAIGEIQRLIREILEREGASPEADEDEL